MVTSRGTVEITTVRVDRKDLGITHADFLRIYPKVCREMGITSELSSEAAPPTDYQTCIYLKTISDCQKREISVQVSEERIRRVGSLKFPYVEVSFSFSGSTADEVESFMLRFDRAFHKGGG